MALSCAGIRGAGAPLGGFAAALSGPCADGACGGFAAVVVGAWPAGGGVPGGVVAAWPGLGWAGVGGVADVSVLEAGGVADG